MNTGWEKCEPPVPSRNLEKDYVADSFYHIYNRGVNKRSIFLDNDDYAVFLNLLKRYLSNKPAEDNYGREYPWMQPETELLAFCLMPNHYHLFIFQESENAMTRLLRGVCTAYTMYFNKKYKRVGPLFQSRFRASLIDNDAYLQHVSRYIHLNPLDYKKWEFSSYPYYMGRKIAEWVQPGRILELFDNSKDYADFVDDYTDHKEMLDDLKYYLAN